jgi:hypothetical protein
MICVTYTYIPSNPASLRNDEFLRALPIAKKERFETLPEILGNVLFIPSLQLVCHFSFCYKTWKELDPPATFHTITDRRQPED